MTEVRIGNKTIGDGHPCFVIAEIGINHNGSLEIAKKLIDAAVESGCDAVKFQKRTIEVVYTAAELAKARESVFGSTNGDLKHGLEFGEREYREIDRYCRAKGILWTASPWDEESVDFLAKFDVPFYKVASASLTDTGLLQHIRSKGKPVILSTGMSTMEQIRNAVEVLGPEDLVVLHCISTYPNDDENEHLSVIATLRREFPGVPIGYSGHGKGTTLSVCAVALGACVVERHITVDRTMWGSDQSASLEPAGLKLMVGNIRRFETALGNEVKTVLASEVPIAQKLRRKTDF